MNYTRRYLFFVFLLGLSQLTLAQKLRYKDVFELIKKGDKVAATPLLKAVIKIDSNAISANLQLGIILYERSFQVDPIKEYKMALSQSDSALFYLGRAALRITEKEVRKNDDYYVPYRKNTKDTTRFIKDYDTIVKRVRNHITLMQTDIKLRKAALNKIVPTFKRAVSTYGIAALLYKTLSERYLTSKELCLLANESDLAKLRSIVQNYDSAQILLQQYKKAIKDYPIPPYNQNITVRSIETYRIDGLSRTDFLAPEVRIWHYADWAKAQLQAIETDIKKLRKDAVYYDRNFTKILEQIQSGSIPYDSVRTSRLDVRFERLFNKYDYNSLGLNWLLYKQTKNEFAALAMNPLNAVENTSTSQIEAKTAYYYDMVRNAKVCDTALQKMMALDYKKEMSKYAFMLQPNYSDTVALKNYMFNEKQFVSYSTREYANRYTQMMCYFLQRFNDSTQYVPYNTTTLPFFATNGYARSEYKTLCIKEDKKGLFYVAGFMGNQAFIAKLNSYKQVVWLKLVPPKVAGSAEFISSIDASESAVIAMLHSVHNGAGTNYLLKLDGTSGSELWSKPIESTLVCRKVLYDEVNEQFTVFCKGQAYADANQTKETVDFANYDAQGLAKWKHSWNVQGTLADVVRVFEGYLIVLNCVSAQIQSTDYKSKAGAFPEQTNILMLKVHAQGAFRSALLLESAKPTYAIGALKVTSNHINIVGINGIFTPGWAFRKDALQPYTYYVETTADAALR